MTSNRFPHLLSPGQIGTMELRNRIAVTAMGVSLSDDDGSVSDRLIAYHEEQAKGGAGLIITGVTGVAWPVGSVSARQTAISQDRYIPGLKRLTERVHVHGAKIAAQLHHGGLVAAYSHARWGHGLWAPSVPPPPTGNFTDYFLPEELAPLQGLAVPEIKVLETAEIEEAVAQFGAAAIRAAEANFDGIEIHAGHGYLISSFLSPATNTRTDGYGGTRERRMRLLREILASVREAVGPSFPVWVKLDSREVGKEGITVDDAIAHARAVEAAGADAITVTTYHEAGNAKLHSQSHTPHIEGFNLSASATIKKAVSIPVIASGRVEPLLGDSVIGEGKADFISMGRKLLADPALPNKLAHGNETAVRPCIYCYTCISAIYMGQPVRCAVNAELGHELEKARPEQPLQAGHVVVIGGGPGGMEAARRLTDRIDRVTLIESADSLGGTLRFASLAYEPNGRLLAWLRSQVETGRVDLRLSTQATPHLIAELNPDHVIVATGARRQGIDLPGSELPHVLSGDDLRQMMFGELSERLREKTAPGSRMALKIGALTGLSAKPDFVRRASRAWMPLGKRIAIIGGGLVGLELAEFLHERGRTVAVIDDVARFGKGLPLVRRMRLLAELEEHAVEMHAGARDIAISEQAVQFRNSQGDDTSFTADQVIIAKGAQEDLSLAEQLKECGFQVQVLGDATGVSFIEGAIHGAREVTESLLASWAEGENTKQQRSDAAVPG